MPTNYHQYTSELLSPQAFSCQVCSREITQGDNSGQLGGATILACAASPDLYVYQIYSKYLKGYNSY